MQTNSITKKLPVEQILFDNVNLPGGSERLPKNEKDGESTCQISSKDNFTIE